MSLRVPGNPKELRTALHAFYEPYAQGVVDFPKVRIGGGEVDELPERTQPIARALIGAWDRIDADRRIHTALVRNVIKNPDDMLALGDGSRAKGMILSGIGRNVLIESVFIPVESKILLVNTTIGPRSAVEQYLENASVELADGRLITGGGFGGAQTPDIAFPVPGPQGVHKMVTHFDARATAA